MLTPLDSNLSLILQALGFAAILLLSVVGGAMISKAWRGRIASWAPTCARCGFDLRARSADLPSACPECGRPLAGCVIPGPRRTAFGRLIGGVILVLLSIGLAAGILFRAPRTVNEWLLSTRSLSSFDSALASNDGRAWRYLQERVRLGRMNETESSEFLDRVIARAVAAGQWSPTDEPIIGAMAQSPKPPPNLERRVLATTLALPNAVRVRAVGEAMIGGRPFAISAEAGRVPQLVKMPLEIRITAVSIVDGAALAPFPATAAEVRQPLWRSQIATALYTAPITEGELSLVVEVELRVADPGTESASPRSLEAPRQPSAPDGGASGDDPATLDTVSTHGGASSGADDRAPVRRFKVPLTIKVKPAGSAP